MKRGLILALLAALAGVALAPASVTAQTLSRPTACASCIANWFYFDEDASGAAGDWNCGTSSYDGHHGSDFSLAGGNGAIATGYDVVAAADGVVERAEDGHFDHCTACGGTGCGRDFGFGYGNHLVINHGSYKVTYAHMRNGSVRVGVGDHVSCGQVIGQIGSSGCSTGAHLHFETRPLGGGYATAFDPFQGGCSPTSPSLWVSQGPHRGLPGATCGGPPPPTCPAGTYAIWTCNAASTERTRCVDGVVTTEPCGAGCISMPAGTNDVCRAPPPPDCGSLGSAYACTADGAARERCVAGMVQSDACAAGCQASTTGGEATCRAPADCGTLTDTYACGPDGLTRARCVAATVETQPCPAGCVVTSAGMDDLCRAPADAGSPDGGASTMDGGPSDGGASDSGSIGADAAVADDGGVARLTGGCSCDLSRARSLSGRLPVLALSLMLLAVLRRHVRS